MDGVYDILKHSLLDDVSWVQYSLVLTDSSGMTDWQHGRTAHGAYDHQLRYHAHIFAYLLATKQRKLGNKQIKLF